MNTQTGRDSKFVSKDQIRVAKHFRVGVGWSAGHCGDCVSCRRGDFVTCRYGQVAGISYDGGYADHMTAPTEALASIPDELSATEHM